MAELLGVYFLLKDLLFGQKECYKTLAANLTANP
jgi:hypothetical protein